MAGDVLRFGVIADIQGGDLDDKSYERKHQHHSHCELSAAAQPELRWRRYRRALEVAGNISRAWTASEERLDFVVQLGDIIEGNSSREASEADLEAVLAALEPLLRGYPFRHVLGNHCLRLPRRELAARLGVTDWHYAWSVERVPQWRLISLDGLDVSLERWQDGLDAEQQSDSYRRAQAIVDADAALEKFNGAIGAAQLDWFERQLLDARRQRQRVLVFCHLPTLAAAANARHLLWNHADVLALLARHRGTVVAWISGHLHEGGYALHDGVHHVTVQAVLECSLHHPITAAIVSVHHDHLQIVGIGDCPSRTLYFEPQLDL